MTRKAFRAIATEHGMPPEVATLLWAMIPAARGVDPRTFRADELVAWVRRATAEIRRAQPNWIPGTLEFRP